MKKAIVTGATSGIGKAISEMLLKNDFEVYGIGRDLSKCSISNDAFHLFYCDLLDEKQWKEVLKQIDTKDIDLLINNAGCAYYGMHETLHPGEIQEMVRLNLEIPMLLSNACIRDLRKNKGTIINIASVSGMGSAPHGAVYGSTKAGLIAFSKSLFEENRKHDVKVTCVIPDMTDTDLYRHADFQSDTSEGCCLFPEDIAEAVENIIHMRNGAVINEIVIRPQYHRILRTR